MCLFIFETKSHYVALLVFGFPGTRYVAQASLELTVIWPRVPECWKDKLGHHTKYCCFCFESWSPSIGQTVLKHTAILLPQVPESCYTHQHVQLLGARFGLGVSVEQEHLLCGHQA